MESENNLLGFTATPRNIVVKKCLLMGRDIGNMRKSRARNRYKDITREFVFVS